MIDISNMNKAKVLAALYNNSKPLGMGFFQFNPKPMNELEAQDELDRNERKYFDYLHGRVMKVDLSKDSFSPSLYDRDNGQGAAQRVIDSIR